MEAAKKQVVQCPLTYRNQNVFRYGKEPAAQAGIAVTRVSLTRSLR
jgi:hypothetical protein